MITFEEVKQIALDTIGLDCALYEDSIIEKPYGWYFCFQSKKYIETGDFREMLAGSGDFIVERETGEVIQFGSAYSSERYFKIYEKGFLGKKYDLIIIKVKNMNLAISLIHKLGMRYVEPEFAYGVEWKIPQEYNEKQIKFALSNLPYTFNNQNFFSSFEVFEEIDKSNCIIYELRKHQK